MRDLFGNNAWQAHYGFPVSALPLNLEVHNEPCPFEPGKSLRETHFIFYGPQNVNGQPLTITRWHELLKNADQPQIFGSEEGWWNTLPCATEATCKGQWYAIYKKLVRGSDEQIPYVEGIVRTDFVPEGYRVPSGIELVTAHLTHLRALGAPMLTNKWAWTSDNVGFDHHMIVGHYERGHGRGENRLRINLNWNREERGSVGFQPIRQLSE